MGRIKRDHGGWRPGGLWLKYKSPAVNERQFKPKAKRDTLTWCGGKRGREHDLYRRYRYHGWDELLKTFIETECRGCRKRFSRKDSSIPLEIPIDEIKEIMPIQVKVNGICLPIDSKWYRKERCESCGDFH